MPADKQKDKRQDGCHQQQRYKYNPQDSDVCASENAAVFAVAVMVTRLGEASTLDTW